MHHIPFCTFSKYKMGSTILILAFFGPKNMYGMWVFEIGMHMTHVEDCGKERKKKTSRKKKDKRGTPLWAGFGQIWPRTPAASSPSAPRAKKGVGPSPT